MQAHARLLMAAVVLSLPAHAALAQGDVRSVVDAANTAFETAFNKGDAPGVAASYAEDALLLAPDHPVIKGKSNIEAFWKGAIGAGLTNLDLSTQEFETSGDMAVEVGEVSYDVPASSGKKTRASGKYIVVWKKNGGSWKLYRDIWNENPGK